jgi:hypothetical protein
MNRVQSTLAVVLLTSCVFGGCVSDSCACVLVPETQTERWIARSPLRDSLELELTFAIGGGTTSGIGIVANAASATKPITATGVYDGSSNSPSTLTITGWFDRPVTWFRTTPRADSLYGVVQLPAGTREGDTLGLSWYRRR